MCLIYFFKNVIQYGLFLIQLTVIPLASHSHLLLNKHLALHFIFAKRLGRCEAYSGVLSKMFFDLSTNFLFLSNIKDLQIIFSLIFKFSERHV